MNGHGIYMAIAIVVLTIIIKTGDAIQCWDCSSDSSGPCRVPFNESEFHTVSVLQQIATNNPRLITCSTPSYYQGAQQQEVCFHRVEVDKRSNEKFFYRGCHILSDGENVGACPKQTTHNDISVEFCEYCNTQRCNGAQGLEKNAIWLSLIPVALALALRK